MKHFSAISRYPLSAMTLAAITYLSLFRPPSIGELQSIPHLDKIVHFCMYASLTSLLIIESVGLWKKGHKANITSASCKSAIAATLFGGLMEILQGSMTDYRSADILDFATNAAGSMAAAVAIWLIIRTRNKKDRL